MALTRGNRPRTPFERTSPSEQREIENDIIDEINDVSELMRTRDSIITSRNFHLDSSNRGHPEWFKVDIQRRRGTRATVAQIHLYESATQVDEARQGFRNCLNDGYIWIVT